MATFIATVAEGLEEVAREELAAFGLAAVRRARGAVTFDGPPFPSSRGFALLHELNHWARSADRVGVLLAEGAPDDLGACYELARGVEYAPLIRPWQSFAVRAERHGAQEFTSVDVAGAVGQAIIDAFASAEGARLRVSLRRPDVIVRVDVRHTSCLLWLDATGDEPLYRRDYRVRLHPASLRGTIAYSMLRLARWRGEPLLDPMTGIGTIPIEAGLCAHAVAPGTFRRGPLAVDVMRRTRDPSDAVPSPREATEISLPGPLTTSGESLDIVGIERYEKHVDGARRSLAATGPVAGVRFCRGDAQRLETRLKTGRYRLVVVNPPFGRKVGSTAIVGALYRRFAASAARIGVERIVALVESSRLMADALSPARFEIVQSLRVMYGRLPARVIVAQRES